MVEETNKIIITILIACGFIGLLCTLVFIDIPWLQTSSIKGIFELSDNVKLKENELELKQESYSALDKSLNSSKEEFESEKAKYEAISDETIKIIKESNTDENYSLEYMWIRLGNYASKNNLNLVMVEPGNKNGMEKIEASNNSTSTKSNETKDQSLVASSDNSSTSSTSDSNVLQIQVAGSYMNLADFVYEVESDKELNFKLDNILMEYVEGTTVRATFDVKNIYITK